MDPVAETLALFAGHYGAKWKDAGGAYAAWRPLVRRYPPELIAAAADYWTMTQDWPPSVAEFVKVVDWIRFDLEWDFHHSPHLERLDPDALGAWVRVVEHLSIFMVDDCARRALLKTVRPLRIADGALIVQPLDAVTAATLARYQAGIERYIIPTRELQAGLPPYNRLRIED